MGSCQAIKPHSKEGKNGYQSNLALVRGPAHSTFCKTEEESVWKTGKCEPRMRQDRTSASNSRCKKAEPCTQQATSRDASLTCSHAPLPSLLCFQTEQRRNEEHHPNSRKGRVFALFLGGGGRWYFSQFSSPKEFQHRTRSRNRLKKEQWWVAWGSRALAWLPKICVAAELKAEDKGSVPIAACQLRLEDPVNRPKAGMGV